MTRHTSPAIADYALQERMIMIADLALRQRNLDDAHKALKAQRDILEIRRCQVKTWRIVSAVLLVVAVAGWLV